MAINISFENVIFQDDSKGIGEINEGRVPREEDDVLKKLETLRFELGRTDALIEAIASLEQAIREQNKPKAKNIVQQLTSNFTSSLLANVVAGIVTPFL